MASFIYDLLTAYSIILKVVSYYFSQFHRFGAWNFHYLGTISCYFGYMDQKWSKITLKICLSTLVWLSFTEKLSKIEAFKLHHAKEHKILYQKQ